MVTKYNIPTPYFSSLISEVLFRSPATRAESD